MLNRLSHTKQSVQNEGEYKEYTLLYFVLGKAILLSRAVVISCTTSNNFIERKAIMSEEIKDSRRDVLKKGVKAAAFVVPMMVTFKLADCKVHASCRGKLNIRGKFNN
jgi:hypothetical protein